MSANGLAILINAPSNGILVPRVPGGGSCRLRVQTEKLRLGCRVAATRPTGVVRGVWVAYVRGGATLTMSRFTAESAASALGATYGMNLLADFPAFGRYIFSLPQIR